MKLQLNHFSQYNTEIPKDQQDKTCGICCVKMVLDFLCPDKKIEINDLLREAIIIKAYDPSLKTGLWTHEGLVRILRNHGVMAYPQEFKSVYVGLDNQTFHENENQELFIQKGIEKIQNKIAQGKPVIASVTPGFNQNRDAHLIVICGYENLPEKQFYIMDPQDSEIRNVPINIFIKHWKKLTIFID